MIARLLVGGVVLVCSGCTTSSFVERPDCAEKMMGEWQVPAAWYNRRLTPEKAHQMVLTGNLGIDLIRDRWEALHEQFVKGDQYWRYRRTGDELASKLGWQEGIVLNRGCRQIGFVATSIQVDQEAVRSGP